MAFQWISALSNICAAVILRFALLAVDTCGISVCCVYLPCVCFTKVQFSIQCKIRADFVGIMCGILNGLLNKKECK